MDASEFLFSTAALEVLNRQQYDPGAKGVYEWLSGGLMWPDERPGVGEAGRELVFSNAAFRCLLASRAAITLGEAGVWPVWEQVLQHAPNWPGLRPERRGEQARKRLLAAKRIADRCLDDLERKFEEERAAKAVEGLSPGGASASSQG